MNNAVSESPYYIFMNGGERMYVLGKTGQYQTELTDAMTFTDKMDAFIFVEKHGYERIATVRKFKTEKNAARPLILTTSDLKKDVIKYCGGVAEKLGYSGLNFVCGDINDFKIKRVNTFVIISHKEQRGIKS